MDMSQPGWMDPIVRGGAIPLNGNPGPDADRVFAPHAHAIAAVIAGLMEMNPDSDPDGPEDMETALAHLSLAYAALTGADEDTEEEREEFRSVEAETGNSSL